MSSWTLQRSAPNYQRAPSSRLGAIQGALAAKWVAFPDTEHLPGRIRVRNTTTHVLCHSEQSPSTRSYVPSPTHLLPYPVYRSTEVLYG